MNEDEVIAIARRAAEIGFMTIVLQSSGPTLLAERMCKIIKEIKRLNVAVTLSIGERTADDYRAFRDAGADRYLMRIETTDRDIYHRLDPGMSWQKRYDA